MSFLNLFYIAVVVAGVSLFFLLSAPPKNELSIYGFAESGETEINYPAPVAVVDILVRPGQSVDSGAVLLHIVRRRPRTTLADQPYRIDELEAQASARADERRQQLAGRRIDYRNDRQRIDEEIASLEEDIEFRRSLTDELTILEDTESDYQPLLRKLDVLSQDRVRLRQSWLADSTRIVRELQLGGVPYVERVKRLEAEADFERDQAEAEIFVTAPSDGLVGTINCRAGEYKNAYANLMTFYEPHSELIRGYLYEEIAVDIDTNHRFEVTSLTDEALRYEGRVIGLGSRIVEIPSRLRKYAEVASYGREVTVAIPSTNQFLQNEKVSLRYLER